MEHRGTVGHTPIRQLGVLIEHRYHRLLPASDVGFLDFAPDFSGHFAAAHSALFKGRVNCVGDLVTRSPTQLTRPLKSAECAAAKCPLKSGAKSKKPTSLAGRRR